MPTTWASVREFVRGREPRWTKHALRPWIVTLWRGVVFAVYNHCVSHVPIYTARRLFLRVFCGISIAKQSSIHMGCFVTGKHIRVAACSVINRKCYLDGRGNIEIGENVSISPEVYILTSTHVVNDPDFGAICGKVQIEDYVWIGVRAIILPNITLGIGCVVGAGSVVAKSVPPYQIVVGNPARIIGERSKDLRYHISYFPLFDTDEILPCLFTSSHFSLDKDLT